METDYIHTGIYFMYVVGNTVDPTSSRLMIFSLTCKYHDFRQQYHTSSLPDRHLVCTKIIITGGLVKVVFAQPFASPTVNQIDTTWYYYLYNYCTVLPSPYIQTTKVKNGPFSSEIQSNSWSSWKPKR